MNVTLDDKAFEVGKEFEDYLEKVIFNEANFTLVEKTHSYSQNSKRFVESSLKPDFKFRCKKTNQKFYVEAKFRSHYNTDDKVQIIKPQQYIRYNEYNKVECPVFIAVGIGGKPSKPNSISLIPLTEIKYLDLYKSVLDKYKIKNDKAYDSKDLKLRVEKAFQQQTLHPIPNNHEIQSKSIWKNNFVRLAIVICLATILYFVALRFQSMYEEKLKAAITKTYSGSVSKLEASYNLTWNTDGTIEGTYYYPKKPNTKYILKGKDLGNGNIQLTEYTGNNISANCNLSLQGNCYIGQMNNTDGRAFKMTVCQ